MDAIWNHILAALPNRFWVGFVCGAMSTLTVVRLLMEFKALLGILRDGLASRRLARARQRQNARDEQEQQKLDEAMNGLHYNSQRLLVDQFNTVYCPDCMRSGIQSRTETSSIGEVYCPRCGWQCSVPSYDIH